MYIKLHLIFVIDIFGVNTVRMKYVSTSIFPNKIFFGKFTVRTQYFPYDTPFGKNDFENVLRPPTRP